MVKTSYDDDDQSNSDWGDGRQVRPCPDVPLEKQRGWWKIDDVETLKNLLMSLNGRGLREKVLQKYLEKNFETVCQSSFKMKKNTHYQQHQQQHQNIYNTNNININNNT
ncbi:hypothetical protein HELRODRAFT_182234 [Helobdella robusta]|uniref:WHIM2 domain-containing protein n=1 Tax=Helobdella robusta TaxID=6412 RepID=T1FHZ0_HELRO|nr:hypothetical protein HELRODRAFT_182234 [Helobdella robusta]ESN91158.1 hypothetical protein HELRODRAFT_182234 [Helobdella robusta]